jgi:hypothetical protein
MSEKRIAVLSAWGDGFGYGHLQRMANLLWRITATPGLRGVLFGPSTPDLIPVALRTIHTGDCAIARDLLVRDMRDPGEEEIRALKTLSPVMVIDDLGAGRNCADHVVDCLPVMGNHTAATAAPVETGFVYGYSFTQGLMALRGRRIYKTIDFAVYGDFRGKFNELIPLVMPPGASYAVLAGAASYVMKAGKKSLLPEGGHAEVLCSARAFLSHFGISFYEARLCGCVPVALNPTEYHSALCDAAPGKLGIVNLGTVDRIDREKVRDSLAGVIRPASAEEVDVSSACDEAIENLDRFCVYIKGVM